MRDHEFDAEPLNLFIDGRPAVRMASGRVILVPSGGDGPEDTENQPADAPAPGDGDAPAEGDAPAGDGDGAETVEEPPALPDDIEAADEAELRALHDQLGEAHAARRQGVRTTADLDVLREIRSRQNAIAAELQRRRDEAAHVAEELAAFDQEQPAALPEATEAAPAMATVGRGGSTARVAAARGRQPAAAQTAGSTPARPRAPMLASVATETQAPGTEMSMEQLGAAIDRAKRSRDGGRVVLASIPSFEAMGDGSFPAMLMSDNGAAVNDRLIGEAVEDHRFRRHGGDAPARTAAICDPLDIIRDIPSAFSTAEPVRGIFPSRPAGRLGFQFTPSLVLGDVSGGVTLWDEADQAAVDVDDSGTWKPCIDVTCPDVETVRAEAVAACLRFDITTEMSNAARVANATSALNAVRARIKEGRILQLIDANASKFTYVGDYGALPSLIEALNTAIAQAVYASRLENPDYVLVLPPAVTQILTIDRANRAYGAEAETSDVLTYLRGNVEGVSEVVQTLDASLGGEPGLPFPAFPASTAAGGPAGPVALPYIEGGDYRIRLVDPSAWIYAETGEMNAGVQRDTPLLRQNKAQFFVEEFFMLAKHGPQPQMTIDMVLCADGSRAGLIEPDSCATS